MFKQFIKNIFTIKSLLFILLLVIIPFIYFYSKSEFIKLNKIKDNEIRLEKDKIILDSISKVKIFDISNNDNIGLHNIVLKTKFENGKVLYIFSADLVDDNGIKYKAITPYPNSRNYKDRFIFNFTDIDGFTIATEEIYLNDITSTVNAKGEKIAIICNSEFNEINKDIYIKIKDVEYSWVFSSF
jgi:hypothetical protein